MPAGDLRGRRGAGGSVGTPTYIPQNDLHDALIILNIHKWGKTFFQKMDLGVHFLNPPPLPHTILGLESPPLLRANFWSPREAWSRGGCLSGGNLCGALSVGYYVITRLWGVSTILIRRMIDSLSYLLVGETGRVGGGRVRASPGP